MSGHFRRWHQGNPNRFQVGRGTMFFRFNLEERRTNQSELQHEDKVQVREKMF
jgi:hypothetical protein